MSEEKQTSQDENPPQRVFRSTTDRWIGGVCSGIAAYFGWEPAVVRIVWVIALFVGGTGGLAYILAWIVIPEAGLGTGEQARPVKANSNLIWGGLLILVGALFLVNQMHWFGGFPFCSDWYDYPRWSFRLRLDWLLPLALILLGVYYLVNLRKPPREPDTSMKSKPTGEKDVEKKFERSLDDRMLGGVCGGISKYFNIDPSFVRIGYVLLSLAGGGFIGVIAYVAMMFIVPEESTATSSEAPAASADAQAKKPAAKSAAKKSSKTAGAKKTSRPKGKGPAPEKGE